MSNKMKEFLLNDMSKRYPNDDTCLEEIKRLRYPNGIKCVKCKKNTKHYKLSGRTAYSCEYCRNQVFPLSGTIFSNSTTPLRTWFFAMYLMTHSWGKISSRNLQDELGVTYKTAWRMSHDIKILMSQNNADLLSESKKLFSWSILNKLELKVVQKKKS